MNFLLRGLLIGFSIAAPVGPIGVLSIRRSLTAGWQIGLLTGLGAATADAIYGCIAGFGLTLVSTFLVSHSLWLRLIGSLFLCYLGVRTLIEQPITPKLSKAEAKSSRGKAKLNAYVNAYVSAVFLTLTNPATILSFAAVFAGLGLASSGADYGSATVLVIGVFLGSALWWLVLSSSVSLLRSRFNPHRLVWLNRISGLILLVFGIISLSSIRSGFF